MGNLIAQVFYIKTVVYTNHNLCCYGLDLVLSARTRVQMGVNRVGGYIHLNTNTN